MERSESITELSAALAKAQGAFGAVPKSGKNPHLESRYATFDDVVATVRQPLAANGLSFVQVLDAGNLTTMLMHESGQYIVASAPIDAMEGNRGTNAMQAFGSTLTYLKRYALSAMLGVTTGEDDDGHASAARLQRRTQQHAAPAPQPEQGNGDAHWIKDESARKSFWAWTNSKGLSNEQVHEALGVEHVEEFTGSKGDAANAITAWLERPM